MKFSGMFSLVAGSNWLDFDFDPERENASRFSFYLLYIKYYDLTLTPKSFTDQLPWKLSYDFYVNYNGVASELTSRVTILLGSLS